MDERNRLNAGLAFLERFPARASLEPSKLHVDQARDDLQVVLDAVVDFLQQDFALLEAGGQLRIGRAQLVQQQFLLALGVLALRDVDDGGQHEFAIGALQRIEADFDGDFGAVLPQPEQFASRAHGSRFRNGQERAPMAGMTLAVPHGYEQLDRFSQQILARVPEQLFHLGVHQDDESQRVDHDHSGGSSLQRQPEPLRGLQSLGDVARDMSKADEPSAGMAQGRDEFMPGPAGLPVERVKTRKMLAEDLLLLVAVESLRATVPGQHPTLAVQSENGVVPGVDQQTHMLLANPVRRPLALRSPRHGRHPTAMAPFGAPNKRLNSRAGAGRPK